MHTHASCRSFVKAAVGIVVHESRFVLNKLNLSWCIPSLPCMWQLMCFRPTLTGHHAKSPKLFAAHCIGQSAGASNLSVLARSLADSLRHNKCLVGLSDNAIQETSPGMAPPCFLDVLAKYWRHHTSTEIGSSAEAEQRGRDAGRAETFSGPASTSSHLQHLPRSDQTVKMIRCEIWRYYQSTARARAEVLQNLTSVI